MMKEIEMNLNNEDLILAKEKKISFEGEAGRIEAIFNGAPQKERQTQTLAILGHPHSLHGGSMNNKVVTTLARACCDVGIANLRFNFRGVGQSEGEFDKGIGESNDLLLIISKLKKQFPLHRIVLAGFSFGAYVTYRAACQSDVDMLISIAPAVNHGNFCEFIKVPNSWHILVALNDEIVPAQQIIDCHKTITPRPALYEFEKTSHFFHGKLVALRKVIVDILSN